VVTQADKSTEDHPINERVPDSNLRAEGAITVGGDLIEMHMISTRKSYGTAILLLLLIAVLFSIPSSDSELSAKTGVRGIVDYKVWSAAGDLIREGRVFNTVNNEGKDETFNRIAGSATGGAFDGIAALDVTVGTDDPSDGVLSTSITLNLDGDSATGGIEENPVDGAVVTDFGTENGNGTIQATFTATANGVLVLQIVLTRADEDDTLIGGANAITDAQIFAYVDVPDITLNTNDTVQYTWTIDVD